MTRWTLVVAFHVSSVYKTIQPWWMACRFTLTQRVLPQGVKFPYCQSPAFSYVTANGEIPVLAHVALAWPLEHSELVAERVPCLQTWCDWFPSGKTYDDAAFAAWVVRHTGGSSWSCATVWGGYNSTANLMGTELQSVSTFLESILLVMVWWLPKLLAWLQ